MSDMKPEMDSDAEQYSVAEVDPKNMHELTLYVSVVLFFLQRTRISQYRPNTPQLGSELAAERAGQVPVDVRSDNHTHR